MVDLSIVTLVYIEIVDLPINRMVDLSIVTLVYIEIVDKQPLIEWWIFP